MARLRLQNPNNYGTSGKISAEFESIIRYLNVAEKGNKTLGELMSILFDSDGEFIGPIELRFDSSEGFQYRVGEYDDDNDGWITIATAAQLKGAPGTFAGEIEGAIFHNRTEFTATASQTVFAYVFDTTDDLLVWTNGILERQSAYTKDAANDRITFGAGRTLADKVTIVTVRASAVSNYRRTDIAAVGSQVVFPFVHTDAETLLVFKNGVFQIPGGGSDYTSSSATDTITMTSTATAPDVISILTVENLALQQITGIMMAAAFVDAATGLIPFAKLLIANGDIPQAKVAGLAAALAGNAKMTIDAMTPEDPDDGDFWMDTSTNPNKLKFFDGSDWLLTSPSSDIPIFTSDNAGQYIRVDGTGTTLELGNINFSTLVPKTYMGAANGVATLDSDGLIPTTQLPEIFSVDTISYYLATGANATDVFIKRIFKQNIRIDGISVKCASGTASIQLSVDGTLVGNVYPVTSTLSNNTLSPVIEIDATTISKRIEYDLTLNSSCLGLEIAISYATLNT